MEEVFLSLGGNRGDVVATFEKAKKMLSELPSIEEFRFSPLFRTSPVSDVPQEYYLNSACTFFTDLVPDELLNKLQEIEIQLGKVAKPKNYPRTIDIDVILYGKHFLKTPRLTLPHPQFHKRLFVLIPLSHLTSHLFLPTEQGEVVFDLAQEIELLQRCSQDSVEFAYA